MSSIRAIAGELQHFCRKADVVGAPRVSISFDNERDAARFEAEILRELAAAQLLTAGMMESKSEFTLYGVNVRLV